MCNRVIFIYEGRLVFDGTPAEFLPSRRISTSGSIN